MIPARPGRGLVAAAAALALLGCSAGSAPGRPPSTPAPPTSPTTGAPATTTTDPVPTSASPPGCAGLATVASWPVKRRARELVVIPVYNFAVADLAPVERSGVGGVLFVGNAPAPRNLHASLVSMAAGLAPDAVPLASADVEGGGVQRLAGAVEPFPWARQMAQTMTAAQIRTLAGSVGREMVAAGVTVDLAPVLDLDDGPGPSATDPDGVRSFSISGPVAAAAASAFVAGLQGAGVLAVVKHFPGLGQSTGNTDYGLSATLPFEQLEAASLPAYRAAIAAGVKAIMVANATVPGLTSLPASVSPEVITGLLRGQLGFTGLILTDSLTAGAISRAGLSVPDAAARAVAAGADLVLFGSTLTPADVGELPLDRVSQSADAIVGGIAAAVASGALSDERLNDAVIRVLLAKGVPPC